MTDKLSRGYEAKLHTREKVLSAEDARKVRKASELTVEVNVDVSEALTGLKALQREAKKATQELKDLEMTNKAIETSEGSPLHYLVSHFGITPSDVTKMTRAEIRLLLASYELRQEVDVNMRPVEGGSSE